MRGRIQFQKVTSLGPGQYLAFKLIATRHVRDFAAFAFRLAFEATECG